MKGKPLICHSIPVPQRCKGCDTPFIRTRGKYQVYCCTECRQGTFYAGTCAYCGVTLVSRKPKEEVLHAIFCSKSCRIRYKHVIKGVYVYGWYRAGEVLPFYIGKGTGKRAWRRDRGSAAVRLYRTGLTDEGAYLVESVLIDLFKSMGAKLKNKAPGIKRVVKGPLTLNLLPVKD